MYTKHLQKTSDLFIGQFSSDYKIKFWTYFNLSIVFNAFVFAIALIPLFVEDNYFYGENFKEDILETLNYAVSMPSIWINSFHWSAQSLIAAFIAGACVADTQGDYKIDTNFLMGNKNAIFLILLAFDLLVQVLVFNGDAFGISAWIGEEHLLAMHSSVVVCEFIRVVFDLLLALYLFQNLSANKLKGPAFQKYLVTGILLQFIVALFFGYVKDLLDFIILGFVNMSDKIILIATLCKTLINVFVFTFVIMGCCAVIRSSAKVSEDGY